MLVNYRKHFLFATDESWAEEGREGFFSGDLPDGLGKLAMGICMHPYFPALHFSESSKGYRQSKKQEGVCGVAWLMHCCCYPHRYGLESKTIRSSFREV